MIAPDAMGGLKVHAVRSERASSARSISVSSRFTISRTSELRLVPSTGLAAFMNFASSDAAASGRFASPSGTSTVSLSHTSVAAGHGASDDLPRSGAAGIDARLVSSAMTGRSCRGTISDSKCNKRDVIMLTEVKQTSFAWLRVSLLACGIATSMLLPGVGHAQADPKVDKALADLKARTARLGAPRLERTEAVGGTAASALYFGRTKINNNFEVVDAVVKEYGGTATLFAKTGNEYVRVSTNVPLGVGMGRAIGTILNPKGKAIVNINKGEPFYGEVVIITAEALRGDSIGDSEAYGATIDQAPYITGYEPIKDSSGKVIGVYFVGYKK